MIAAVIVALWQVRNTALWEGVVAMPHGVWRSALAAWQQWEKAYDSSAADSMTNLVSHINPMPSTLICSVDAGVDHESNCVTFGVFLASSEGGFVAAVNDLLDCILDPLMAEAMACKEALKWIKSRGVMEVSVRSDCLNLIQVLVGNAVVRSYLGSIIYDCRAISGLLSSCVFQYVPRSANRAAHALAKAVGSHAGRMYWEGVPPPFLLDLI